MQFPRAKDLPMSDDPIKTKDELWHLMVKATDAQLASGGRNAPDGLTSRGRCWAESKSRSVRTKRTLTRSHRRPPCPHRFNRLRRFGITGGFGSDKLGKKSWVKRAVLNAPFGDRRRGLVWRPRSELIRLRGRVLRNAARNGTIEPLRKVVNLATFFRFKLAAIPRSNSGADSHDKKVAPFDSESPS